VRRGGRGSADGSSYEDLISGRSVLTTIRNIGSMTFWVAIRWSSTTPAWRSGSATASSWSPARAAPSARNYAADRSLSASADRALRLSEAALYEIQMALGDAFPQLPLVAVVGDVKHEALVDEVLARSNPASSSMPGPTSMSALMEETNAWQAVRSNAWGTWVLRARGRGQGREIRAGFLGQGGEPHQCHGRNQTPGGNRLPEPRAVARSSSWCDSAMSSAVPAA
jgi:hypothetical protein